MGRSATTPTRIWMWPPRTDAARTSRSDSIAVHGWASMSDPPIRHARRASGVHGAALPVGRCMSTTATRPPGRVATVISATARGQFGIRDNA